LWGAVAATMPVEPRFGLRDAVGIVVGIVVGTAIFRSPALVFRNTPGPAAALGVWALGGGLCLCGALCYAELATTYPRNGGDYEYLGRAFGRPVGFLFAWSQLWIVLTASLGAMAYAFADYGVRLLDLAPAAVPWLAGGAVVVLSLVNLAGVAAGRTLQNVLTGVKVLGLAGVVVAALFGGGAPAAPGPPPSSASSAGGAGLALVFVLYAYGGWNDAVYVAAEVRDRRRNLPRALLLGLAGILAIYLAVNAAYVSVLGFAGARASATPAADVLARTVGPWGVRAISALVMVSALGAIQGMLLTGSRVYATVGEDYRLFRWLARWSRRAAPAAALVLQAAIALLLVLLVGTGAGRGALDALLAGLGLPPVPWGRYPGGFEALVAASAPVFWTFFLLSGVAYVVLRVRDGARPRPFAAPWFPLPAVVFLATCVAMLRASLAYAGWLALLGAAPLLPGLLFCRLSAARSRSSRPRAP